MRHSSARVLTFRRQQSLLPPAPATLQVVPQQSFDALLAPLANELWFALRITELPLVALSRSGASSSAAQRTAATLAATPGAVLTTDARVPQVLAVNAAARARGVRPELALSAALALAPNLHAVPRAPQRERALLEALAAAMFEFTPRVSLAGDDSLLLEVRGSLGLFGGIEALSAAVAAAVARCTSLTAQLALAPTPLAALTGARAGRALCITHAAQLVGDIGPLPLTALDWPAATLERLATMGVRSIAQALRLPRAGFAKRFGKPALLGLDRLVGAAPDPRAAFTPRQRFRGRAELNYELTDHAHILQAFEPLLQQLERFLRARQCGITLLHCGLRHRPATGAGPRASAASLTKVEVRLAAPELAAERFTALLREHLERIVLPAPVIRCELRSGPLLAFAPGSENLWRGGEHGAAAGQEAPAFIERLRARLGNDAVYGLCLVDEHRPEASWSVAEPGPPVRAASPRDALASRSARPLQRPLWLLDAPQSLPVERDALAAAGYQILQGPERIETGWWDGRDIARDYYLVRDAAGGELWLYRERAAPHGWFVHGVFG